MRKLIALAAAAALFAFPALAAPVYVPGQQGAVGPNVAATNADGAAIRIIQPSVTLNDATGVAIGTAGNPLFTSPSGSGATASQVQGNVASGASDSGTNPVKIGCVFNTALPTLTNGQRGDCQANASSQLEVELHVGSATSNISTAASGQSIGLGGLTTNARQSLFNGTSMDLGFTCANSATVSVTAGSTTQIVALSGSTVIRVCSLALSMSAAGTAGVYTGTGTNCGTGTTALIQDMTLATGTPLVVSSGNGAVVRSSAGGALCVKATTGNVTGVITYTQF